MHAFLLFSFAFPAAFASATMAVRSSCSREAKTHGAVPLSCFMLLLLLLSPLPPLTLRRDPPKPLVAPAVSGRRRATTGSP